MSNFCHDKIMSSLTAFSKCRTVEDISCSTHDSYAHILKSFPSVSGTVYFKRKVNCKIVTSPSTQMVSPENIHVSSVMETEQVIFRNISAGAYMHICIKKKWKRRKERKERTWIWTGAGKSIRKKDFKGGKGGDNVIIKL